MSHSPRFITDKTLKNIALDLLFGEVTNARLIVNQLIEAVSHYETINHVSGFAHYHQDVPTTLPGDGKLESIILTFQTATNMYSQDPRFIDKLRSFLPFDFKHELTVHHLNTFLFVIVVKVK